MKNSETNGKISARDFLNNVLAGMATGILVGLIPNAVLSGILKLFGNNPIALQLSRVLLTFQFTTPLLIGVSIALAFNLSKIDVAIVAGASYVGSGVTLFNPKVVHPVTKVAGLYLSKGTGDLINTMITASLTVAVTLLIGDKFGSVKIIASPIIVGAGCGWIGLLLLPYVGKITVWIGDLINTFTKLQPLLMSVLICCMFAALTVTPISTVAIGMAIQLHGLSAGAAAMGVTAITMVLVVHSWKANNSGVTIAIALGGMKTMIPNLFRHPIILLPTITTAIISAIPVAIFGVSGTPESAGFGLVGLVGPLASISAGSASINIVIALLVWFVIPAAAALASRFVYQNMLHIYDEKVVFAYLGE